MMNFSRRRFLGMGANAGALTLASRARAEGYPVRPVRAIVPFAPAGQTDVIGRILAQELSEFFGTQFYVENMPGAGGTIGVGRAARAAPEDTQRSSPTFRTSSMRVCTPTFPTIATKTLNRSPSQSPRRKFSLSHPPCRYRPSSSSWT
jgi:tripartite-type tricarboxylate transporter receptor subunit TctC